MKPFLIHSCPICGSKRIKRIKRDITSNRGGRKTVVPNVEVDECPDCHECLFSPEAVNQIAAVTGRTRKQTA